MQVDAPPNFYRPGVIAGFAFYFTSAEGLGYERVVFCSKGVLFAQDTLYRPATFPTLPLVPLNQQSWLFYNSSSGFYWGDSSTPNLPDDAALGWAVADDIRIRAVSRQLVEVPDPHGGLPIVIQLGPVQPGRDSEFDTAAPPQPVFGLMPWTEYVEVCGIAFEDLSNCHSIHTAWLTLYHWDETGVTRTTLSADISETHLSLTAPSLAGFTAGDFAVLDREIIQLTAIDAEAATIERGKFGSTPAAHTAGLYIIRLEEFLEIIHFPNEFFGTPESGVWSHKINFVDNRVCAASLYVTNQIGDSPIREQCYTYTVDRGLRIRWGRNIELYIMGVLAIQSDACAPAYLAIPMAIRDIYAYIWDPPLGANLTIDVTVGGVSKGTLTILAGETGSDVIDGATLDAWPADTPINLDITQVGSTFPGEMLTVIIRL